MALRKVCKSDPHAKIISFFHENPSTVDTSQNLAAWLNFELSKIEKALDYLVKQNILIVHQTGSTTAYAYTQDKETIKEIAEFLKQLKWGRALWCVSKDKLPGRIWPRYKIPLGFKIKSKLMPYGIR